MHADNIESTFHNTTCCLKMKPAHRSSSLLALVALFISLSSAHNTGSHGNYKGRFSQVYAFGGSETDTGNAHFLGVLPDGDDRDSSSQGSSSPVGNSTRRFTDGRLVVDFLCEALSLPLLSPYKGPSADSANGVNFAVAGSTALMKAGCKEGDARSCKVDMENSLFWIGEMGVSDYISALQSSTTLPRLADISVRSVCKLLKTLLDNGAKHVIVQGLPPVGCFPAYISSNSKQKLDHMGCVATDNFNKSNEAPHCGNFQTMLQL